MSLRPQHPEPVPDETARVARAAFATGNQYLQMRDTLDAIYADTGFLHLFPAHGKPGYAPWRLALATIFRFAEHLPDRQAAADGLHACTRGHPRTQSLRGGR